MIPNNPQINPKSIAMKKDESWLLRYLRVLRSTIDDEQHFDDNSEADLEALGDLIDSGYIKGNAIVGSDGLVKGASVWEVTLQGHLFAEEQQRIIDENSTWGKIKNGAGLAIGWFAGVASALVVYYVTKG